MGLIDRPETGESIVIGIHAKAEWTIVPFRFRAPMLFVMVEAIHLLLGAFQLHIEFLVTFSLFFLLSLLFELSTRLTDDFFLD